VAFPTFQIALLLLISPFMSVINTAHLIATLLLFSPRIACLTALDATFDRFEIRTPDRSCLFPAFLALCTDGFNDSVTPDSINFFQSVAGELGNTELVDDLRSKFLSKTRAISWLAASIDSIEWDFDVDFLNEIISHPSLKVSNEDSLFDSILHDSSFLSLLEHVRFELVSQDRIYLLFDQFWPSFECISLPMWRSLLQSFILPRYNDFLLSLNQLDGIIASLTKSYDGNVHDRKIVAITARTIFHNRPRMAPRNVADFQEFSVFRSKDAPSQWIRYDFNEMRVAPTHYSIRSDDKCCPKSWVLEGSVEGTIWIELDRREDNDTFHLHTFPIFYSTEQFQLIRFRQTGLNYDQNNTLSISAFEVFGSLIEVDKEKKSSPLPIQETKETMHVISKISLSNKGLVNVPEFCSSNEFTFEVGERKWRFPVAYAAFISPRIDWQIRCDPNICHCTIATTDPNEFFNIFLRLGSGESIEINHEAIDFMLAVCHELDNTELSSLIDDYLVTRFNEEAVMNLLQNHESGLTKSALLSSLPNAKVLDEILWHRTLSNGNEDMVCDLVLRNSSLISLFEDIRFEFVSPDRICDLFDLASPSFEIMTLSVYRGLCARLVLVPDDPVGGVIEILTEQCQGNVHDCGVVLITAKSVAHNSESKTIAELTNNKSFFSDDTPGQWICYDFKQQRVKPTHYCIRSAAFYFPKGWVIEGSNDVDGVEWFEIEYRVNNNDLNGKYRRKVFCTSHRFGFRQIRLRLISENHFGNYQLALASLEVFGSLVLADDQEVMVKAQQSNRSEIPAAQDNLVGYDAFAFSWFNVAGYSEAHPNTATESVHMICLFLSNRGLANVHNIS
jgi:hypothetical protein